MTGRDDRWNENREVIVSAADHAGIDRGIMAKISGFESGFRHDARPISRSRPGINKVQQFDGQMAISSAYGYGQFLDGTWLGTIRKYGEKYGLESASSMTMEQANSAAIRMDPYLQAAMLAELTKENIAKGRRLGGRDSDANVYAFHNLGDSDATKFLQALRNDPNQEVGGILSSGVIDGNPSLYGDGSRTVMQSYHAMGDCLRQYESYAVDAMEFDAAGQTRGAVTPDMAHPDVRSFSLGRIPPTDNPVRVIQQNLNAMGITDARGQALVVDGNRGGLGSHTNEAIATFQRQAGLGGEMGNTELLNATVAALHTRQTLDFGQALHGILPETMQQKSTSHIAGGVPDYLLHGRGLPDQTARATISTRSTASTHASIQPSPTRPLPVTQTLQPGDHGEGVLALQMQLRALGARDRQGREIECDRDYGPRTHDAVEQFQLWVGHEPTGIADAQTLRELQVQGQYAARQRANGVGPSDHLSGNLMRAPADWADAATQRPIQGRGVTQVSGQGVMSSAALMPYSDTNHPKHGLYSELKGTLESMGYTPSEDRLHQVTGKMDLNGLRPGPQNRYLFSNDNNTLHVVSDIPGFRAHQSLVESAPPVGQTMQQVQAEQMTQARDLERMTQVSRVHTPSVGPTMGVH